MKIIKLSAIAVAVAASTAAMAAEPVVLVDADDVVVAEPVVVAQPVATGYQYNSDAGIIRNTTGAVVGTTRTLFDTVTHPAAVSAEVGTLGYGANIAWGLNENTELQAGWAGGDVADLFGGDFDAHDVNYEVETDFSNPYMGVQLRPAANWFTMGAGIIVPDNSIDVTANPNGDNGGVYKIDGQEYSANDIGTLKGTLEHRNKLAPYATIGFRPNINNHWGVFGELGGAYLGNTDATIEVDGNAANPALAAEAAKKAEAELEDKNYAKWLPIVKLGATYRF
ncbi:hypothetical protein PSAR109036_07480 [Psychrobacter arenosus]|uniref:hypothetical protein n=1 Tax=Psychrobacter arenosus TaxID=256326 RepID=UPI0019189561|nr:hypothetical protein [Psychrobacter arenosus]